LLLLRNRYSGRKWRILSHRKRMPLNGSFIDWSVCLLTLKHLVSLQARVRPSVQVELDVHTPDIKSWYIPMTWLGQIRTHLRDETWSGSLWQTFFVSCVGANIPVLSELPLFRLWLQEVSVRPVWWPPLHLYHPIGW
jgi:hypothetical protein